MNNAFIPILQKHTPNFKYLLIEEDDYTVSNFQISIFIFGSNFMEHN